MRQATNLEFVSDDQTFGIRIEYKEVLKILKICGSAGNTEVGGIVIGLYNTTYNCALVKVVTNAPSDSLRGSTWFHRGIWGLQERLNRLWYGRQYFYLGEWHFHPNHSAHASSTDIEQMREIAISEQYNCPEPILLICGGNPNAYWELNAYVFPRNRMWVKLREVVEVPPKRAIIPHQQT